MKITTKKIIRELEKKGYKEQHLNCFEVELIRETRNIIDEILRQYKQITIK